MRTYERLFVYSGAQDGAVHGEPTGTLGSTLTWVVLQRCLWLCVLQYGLKLMNQDKFAQAFSVFHRIMRTREEVMGPMHPLVIQCKVRGA